MELHTFRNKLIELHQKSGMDSFCDWPFVYDEDEKGVIFVDSNGRFWFADENRNWIQSHLTLELIESMRYSRCFDDPRIDMMDSESDEVSESYIYLYFSSGDILTLQNWHDTSNIDIWVEFVKTDINAESIESISTLCKKRFEYITIH